MATGQSTTVAQVEYRDIPGFPGYRVGDDGSVWTCKKIVIPKGAFGRGGVPVLTDDWRRIGARVADKGHLIASLYHGGRRSNGGVRRQVGIHRLVLEAFVGPCPEGMEGCHSDGDPKNNSLANLRWDTPAANWADRYSHGTATQGEKHGASKLTDDDVLSILYVGRRMTEAATARVFGISNTVIGRIRRREAWKHLATPTA